MLTTKATMSPTAHPFLYKAFIDLVSSVTITSFRISLWISPKFFSMRKWPGLYGPGRYVTLRQSARCPSNFNALTNLWYQFLSGVPEYLSSGTPFVPALSRPLL